MSPSIHAHPVNAAAVSAVSDAVISMSDAEALGRLLALLSDPVRVRVLFALVETEELCVGDIALVLGISMDQSSYALKLLRSSGLVQSRRDGRVIYYRLADEFPHQLLEHCMKQLLDISMKKAR